MCVCQVPGYGDVKVSVVSVVCVCQVPGYYTGMCVCQVPGYGDVKVSVVSVPQSVVVGTTFTVNLKVVNCS